MGNRVNERNRDFSPITTCHEEGSDILLCHRKWQLGVDAYLLHKVGVPLRAIAFVLGIGAILGNLAAYAGVKLAAKVLGRPPGHFE